MSCLLYHLLSPTHLSTLILNQGESFGGADEEISDTGPEHPSSPDYVSGPEHPPVPVYLPYVPEPEYPDYLAPSDDEAPTEDQSLPDDASPIALSPGYGDGDDEPSDDDDDDDDTDDEEEEPSKDEDDDEEEKEHLASADSSAVPITDPIPLAGDTGAF
ncbi:hypothetical protein Tco_0520324 [Tanacetum coccineum]